MWKITKIEASGYPLKHKDEMMKLIKEALIASDISSLKDYDIKVKLDYISEPWFIQEEK